MAGKKKVKFDDVDKEIQVQLEKFWKGKEEQLFMESEVVAKEVVKEIKDNAQVRTGRYKAGWDYKSEVSYDAYGGAIRRYVVYNKDRYQLAHLLNNGHATKKGGWVQGNQHITKVYVKIPEKLTDLARKVIK